MLHNPANNGIYSANWFSDSVAVIDGATNEIIAMIPVGYEPGALGYNSANNKVYCANYLADNITVIDGAADTIITTVTTGVYPYALLYNGTNNTVYCARYYDASVAIIDTCFDIVSTEITLESGSCAFTWNPIQNRTYVANAFSSSISTIRDDMSIEENRTEQMHPSILKISPNPTNNFIKFHGPNIPRGNALISIYNEAGILVQQRKMASLDGERSVSLKGLDPGVYFLEIRIADKTDIVRKVVLIK